VRHPGSFRDPAGFIFLRAGLLYRQVNQAGKADYDQLIASGLYAELVGGGLLIAHTDVTAAFDDIDPSPERYAVLQPAPVATISYPYEWCFSQLQDAALATLAIQQAALRHGMILKDASAYNIQFHEGKPVCIDTLSFTAYTEGQPWQAYKQFCQHFLVPLALMAHVDPDLRKLSVTNIDGIPLPLAVKLLPKRKLISPGLLMHLGLHARTQARSAGTTAPTKATLSRLNLDALLDSLTRTVRGLSWQPAGTEWGNYYSFTNYSDAAFDEKKRLVGSLIKQVAPETTWDLGGNTGEFSRLASAQGSQTVCFDIDPVAIERNYRTMKRSAETNHLPLLQDLTNPSPAIGWANAERSSLAGRGPVDLVMALALIHHLALSNNLPFDSLAAYFATLGEHLIIEFVPKTDSKVKVLLSTRPDIFPDYTQTAFEQAFSRYYTTLERLPIAGTQRTLYLFKARP
jgi:ribosomal protein L11 methylase PrmA